MRIRQLLRASASAAVLSAVMASAAFAQDEPAADENTVDSIIVTANKREQNLQDVPATVTALSGELMQDAGVKDIKDLTIMGDEDATGSYTTGAGGEYEIVCLEATGANEEGGGPLVAPRGAAADDPQVGQARLHQGLWARRSAQGPTGPVGEVVVPPGPLGDQDLAQNADQMAS